MHDGSKVPAGGVDGDLVGIKDPIPAVLHEPRAVHVLSGGRAGDQQEERGCENVERDHLCGCLQSREEIEDESLVDNRLGLVPGSCFVVR